MIINKNVELDFPCPECGNKRKFKLKDLEKNPNYICESCKKMINIDGRNFCEFRRIRTLIPETSGQLFRQHPDTSSDSKILQ